MSNKAQFNEIYDQYTKDGVEYLIEDNSIFDTVKIEDGFDAGFNPDIELLERPFLSPNSEPSDPFQGKLIAASLIETKIPEKKEGAFDSELRLLNNYFKEMATDSLLTPEDQVEIATKIKDCQIRVNKIQKQLKSLSSLPHLLKLMMDGVVSNPFSGGTLPSPSEQKSFLKEGIVNLSRKL